MHTAKFILFISFSFIALPSVHVAAQQLTGTGSLTTGVMRRVIDDTKKHPHRSIFEYGDLIYVTVLQHKNTGSFFVSAHMEYRDVANKNDWKPVPTNGSVLANDYVSGRFEGLRDFVEYGECDKNTTRHICLFIPYSASALPLNRSYSRRYSIVLWDGSNDPKLTMYLNPEVIRTSQNEEGKTVITTVFAKACSGLMSQSTDPVPQSIDEGSIRFFNTKNGVFVCPAGK